jgi:hypothetical protein
MKIFIVLLFSIFSLTPVMKAQYKSDKPTALQLENAAYSRFVYPASLDSVLINIQFLDRLLASTRNDSVLPTALINKYTKRIKDFNDHWYYRSLWDQAINEPNKEARILILMNLRNIAYYTFDDEVLFHKAKELYCTTMLALIREYRGDLANLLNLDVHGSCWPAVVQSLKKEIISAGGIWDRGDVDDFSIEPPILGRIRN